MLSLLTGMGVPIPTQQETLNLITEKPPAIVEQIKEPTLEEKIKKNAYNCNTDTHYIRADNARCLAKPNNVASTPQKQLKGALRGSGSRSAAPAGWYQQGWCTYGAWLLAPWVGSWGNAHSWAAQARSDGFTVSSVPIAGSVFVDTSGQLGHVGYVLSVGSGSITVKDMNYTGFGQWSTRTVPASSFVYIYPPS